MSEDAAAVLEDSCGIKKEMSSECRTCLQAVDSDEELHFIFQTWNSRWEGLEETIAESLQRIAQIELSDMDPHSKVMCQVCCDKLHSATLFTRIAQQSDFALQQRYSTESKTSIENKWPKPIQIDKNVPYNNQIYIKEEKLSDEEYNNEYMAEEVNDVNLMEIKIEPVEILPQQEISIEFNANESEEQINEEKAKNSAKINDDELILRRKKQNADRARAYRKRKKNLDAMPSTSTVQSGEPVSENIFSAKVLRQKQLNMERCRRYRLKCKRLKSGANFIRDTSDSNTSSQDFE